MIAILCALLGGAMFYFAEGLDAVWLLGWFAPIPLLWLAYGNVPRWQLFLASVAAFAWGQVYVLQCYGGLSLALALRVGLPPTLLFGAAVLFAGEARNRLPAMVALFAFPAIWAGIDYILGALLPDGPFASLANAQAPFPAGIQVASLFGFSAVTFLLCLFSNAAALFLKRDWKPGGLGAAVCAIVLAFGFIRLQQPQGASLHVIALADTGARIKSWKARTIEDSLAATAVYATKIRALAAQGGKMDVVAIPEGAIAMHSEWRDQVLAPLAAAAKDTGTLIVAGTQVPAPPVINRAFAFFPDGAAISYDKRHPLIPFETEIPGTAPGLLGAGRAMVICKDMDFPASIRADVQSGIRVMVVPASDLGRDDWIHARIAILRSVENGFAMLRPAFNGLETASDGYGRILASANTSRMGMIALAADLPLGPGPTLYTRIGDVFAWLSIIVSLLMAATMLRKPVSGLRKDALGFTGVQNEAC
jgi:apolipoprotein N-acyltransferase